MYKKEDLKLRGNSGRARKILEERWMEGGLDQNALYACMEFSNKKFKDFFF